MCVVFLQMVKQAMLFDSPHGFYLFDWRLQVKSLYSQSLLVHELKLPVKKKNIIFHGYKILYPNPGCYTGKKLFFKKIKIICNLPKRAQERVWI